MTMRPGAQPDDIEPAGADADASKRLERAAERARGAPDIPLIEWVFAAVGFALVAGTIGFIAWRGIVGEGAPPQVSFQVDAVSRLRDGYLVEFHASNRGDRTAADVTIKGDLAGPAGSVETSEMSFKYLPPRSTRKGGLYFEHDPAGLSLTLRAQGYEGP